MRPRGALAVTFFLLASPASTSSPPVEVIDGCQGEGCDCFEGLESHASRKPDETIKAIRAFTLRKEMSGKSKVVGTFKIGTIARPLGSKMLVLQKGKYVVRKVDSAVANLSVGDAIDTKLYLGEGFSTARKGGIRVDFKYDQVELETISETQVDEWLKVSVGKVVGYTKDAPFAYCLE
jgi:hypothetical protein